MIIVNGLKACDTCRKVVRTLSEAGHSVQLRDFREAPPSRAEITAWSEKFGAALLNTRSTTWRGLSVEDRGSDPVDLMVAHPTLIKRPVISGEGVLLHGWTDATRSALGLTT
ncbi:MULTISPECIES: ArsC/Spx/MgsR family protein [Jannaschia]|nr:MULTISPECIES: ArsC/Spx/MgsR family protein [unclassified Jannaschia]